MNKLNLLMGCMSSRAAVAPSQGSAPSNSSENNQHDWSTNTNANGQTRSQASKRGANGTVVSNSARQSSVQRRKAQRPLNAQNSHGSGANFDESGERQRRRRPLSKKSCNINSENNSIMSATDLMSLMNAENDDSDGAGSAKNNTNDADNSRADSSELNNANGGAESTSNTATTPNNNNNTNTNNGSSKDVFLDGELNSQLLEEYLIVDHEITVLEEREPLRLYHEKIENLENLERELVMVGAEVEGRASSDPLADAAAITSGSDIRDADRHLREKVKTASSPDQLTNLSYATMEEIFNRKVILEKQRDRLKKEVEVVIRECDILQLSYKKRDSILDKLFDGHSGSGLENHLEQQLNWLLEQKHYVDQVFYAWKRAETLTSQSCEKFATALAQLKSLAKATDGESRRNLAKSIKDLLINSRHDMEKAQRYNPNVDAPFFTGNETQRFEKIIETLDSVVSDDNTQMNNKGAVNDDDMIVGVTIGGLSQADYTQLISITQFAYKRSMSIRLWLEQILQTTIARDSFELAEEYKWIAIQLRKERINLVKLALQEPSNSVMIQSVKDRLERLQQQEQTQMQSQSNAMLQPQLAAIKCESQNQKGSQKTRDSGIESEANDMDIEEEIYRLLEENRARTDASGGTGAIKQLQVSNKPPVNDEAMRERIERRARNGVGHPSASFVNKLAVPAKLKIELDEDARKSLQRQVGQLHVKHRTQVEKLRGTNRAKAASIILDKMQQSQTRQQSPVGRRS